VAFLTAGSPGVPYNVRELFGRGGLLAVFGFPIAAAVMLAPPILIARWTAQDGWRRAVGALAWVLGHGVAVWTVLRAAVPLESIHDVVGSPILQWPGDLETMVRFLALFSTISSLYVSGALLAATLAGHDADRDRRALLRWLAAAAPLLLIGHLVVVAGAATDNLTELMAGGGSVWSSVWLGMMVIGFAAATTALAGMLRRRVRGRTAVMLLWGGLILGWMAMALGTAPAITKYGKTFSAMQFLLSPDRLHYAAPAALVARYVVAYVLLVVAGAVAQAPFAGSRHRKRRRRRTVKTEGLDATPRGGGIHA
jgi:hypothetical protein